MLKKLSFYIIGNLISTLGIAIILKTTVGAGPWDAVFAGAYGKVGLTIGVWSMIVQAIVLFINAWISKKRPIYESSITILIRGLFLDFWMIIVLNNVTFENSEMTIQWIMYIVGTLLLAAGVGIYISSKLPSPPIDELMIVLSEKFNLSLKVSRTIVECIALALGLLLGGPVGLGTVFMALTLGYMVQLFNKYAKNIYEKI